MKIWLQLNVLPPSIEPRASGHMIEQQELIARILEAGYAYEVNGSVYFDVARYNQDHDYGILSGRKIEDLISNTRALDGQSEKRNPMDFSLWKKADPCAPYAMVIPMGRRLPWMAPGVLSHEYQVPGHAI